MTSKRLRRIGLDVSVVMCVDTKELSMFACDELSAEIEQVLQKKVPEACPSRSQVSTSDCLGSLPTVEAVPQLLPLEGTDRESRTAELLNLLGCRMWWEGKSLVIGYWPCFDGPELRMALSMVEGSVTIRALTEPDVPPPYSIRHVPWKAPDEPLAGWIRRRRADLGRPVVRHDDADR